jgi:hypothetical protein
MTVTTEILKRSNKDINSKHKANENSVKKFGGKKTLGFD